MTAMEMMIDLHAADVDQPGTAFPRFFEAAQGFIQTRSEKSGAMKIEREGLQRSPLPGFGQTDRIKHPRGTSYRLAASVISRSQTCDCTGPAKQEVSEIKLARATASAIPIPRLIRAFRTGLLAIILRRRTVMGTWASVGLAGGVVICLGQGLLRGLRVNHPERNIFKGKSSSLQFADKQIFVPSKQFHRLQAFGFNPKIEL